MTSTTGKPIISTIHSKSQLLSGDGVVRISKSSVMVHSMEMDRRGMMLSLGLRFWYDKRPSTHCAPFKHKTDNCRTRTTLFTDLFFS